MNRMKCMLVLITCACIGIGLHAVECDDAEKARAQVVLKGIINTICYKPPYWKTQMDLLEKWGMDVCKNNRGSVSLNSIWYKPNEVRLDEFVKSESALPLLDIIIEVERKPLQLCPDVPRRCNCVIL